MNASSVVQRDLRLVHRKRPYVIDAAFPVLIEQVVADDRASVGREVDVDVGHILASPVDKPREKKVVVKHRVNLGDPEQVAG